MQKAHGGFFPARRRTRFYQRTDDHLDQPAAAGRKKGCCKKTDIGRKNHRKHRKAHQSQRSEYMRRYHCPPVTDLIQKLRCQQIHQQLNAKIETDDQRNFFYTDSVNS